MVLIKGEWIMFAVEERVDRLEDLMAQLLETTAQTSRELREFKEEMRASRERSEREMREFTEEMREFKNETRQEQKNFRRQMGEHSRQIGRLVEDIVAPGVPRIFREITGLAPEEIEFKAERVKRKAPNSREFDVVIARGGYVLVNETKATLKPEYVNDFYQLMRDQIRLYFPEYEACHFIGIVSSLYVDESVVRLSAKLGLYVLGFGEDLMDVLNPPDFKPVYF